MRVYLRDNQIPMQDVTWDILCNFATYVDYGKDTDVKWSARIASERGMAINKICDYLGIKK